MLYSRRRGRPAGEAEQDGSGAHDPTGNRARSADLYRVAAIKVEGRVDMCYRGASAEGTLSEGLPKTQTRC